MATKRILAMTSFLKKILAIIAVSAMILVSTGVAYAHKTGYRHQHDNSAVVAGAIVGTFIGITLGAIIADSAQNQQQQRPQVVLQQNDESWNYLINRPWRWDYYKSVTRLGKPVVQWNSEAGQYIEYRYAVQGNLYQYCTSTDRDVACAW